jgi:hypothetical protein
MRPFSQRREAGGSAARLWVSQVAPTAASVLSASTLQQYICICTLASGQATHDVYGLPHCQCSTMWQEERQLP